MKFELFKQGFGAEVLELDVNRKTSDAEIAELRHAYDTSHLLVFRNCGRIAPERQVEIVSWFGDIISNANTEGGRPWTILHNDAAIGSEILPFHCDITFMEFPLAGISLHALELPNSETSTTFISNALAWRKLDSSLKEELHDLKAHHCFDDSEAMNLDWPVLEYSHPVRLTHSRTGMPLLFVTQNHVDYIVDVPENRSSSILKQLFNVLYAPEHQYEHIWQLGDLVIWDNFAIQHARTRPAPPSAGVRSLQRVTLGKMGFAEQLNLVRNGSLSKPEVLDRR